MQFVAFFVFLIAVLIMGLLRKIIYIIISVVSPIIGLSQSSVRISVFGGGNVDFIFNSIGDYKAGLIYPNFTLIGIEVIDAVDLPLEVDYTRWELRFEANDANGDGNFNGSKPLNILPLSVIELSATQFAGCAGCDFSFSAGFLPLSNVSQLLVDGDLLGAADDIPPNLSTALDQINITYRCGVGVANNILRLSPAADYYADDIFIDLIMSP